MNKIWTFVLLVILTLSNIILPMEVPVAAKETGSILFDFEGIEGAEFSIYKAAEIDQDEYRLAGDFAQYDIDLETKTAPETLAHYVKANGITPLKTAKTGSDGTILFDGLEKGYYLILGGAFEKDGVKYKSSPVTVMIPGADTQDASLSWDRHIYAKYGEVKPDDEPTEISVQKIWKNDDAANRPESIVVQLKADGEVYQEAALTEENNWRVTWKDLKKDVEYSVIERDKIDGYSVSITQEGDYAFIITNTKHTPPGDHNPPTDHNPPERLPQTGQLWWPVCLLLSLGMLSIIIGLKIGHGKED